MALIYSETNPTTQSEHVFNFKELAKTAGYSVLASGTGTGGTYNASGDDITNAGTGAGGMNRSNAWFRLRSPDGVNEWVFQRGTTDSFWRIKNNMSSGNFFTELPIGGGSISESVTPSSISQYIHEGGGTDAAPAFGNVFSSSSWTSNYNMKILFDNSPPYGWWTGGWLIGLSQPLLMVWDPLVATAPGDIHKYVFYSFTNNNVSISNITAETTSGGIRRMNTTVPSTSTFTSVHTYGHHPHNGTRSLANIAAGHGISTNPVTGRIDELPVIWGRNNTTLPSFYKGVSAFTKWTTQNLGLGQVGDNGDGTYRLTFGQAASIITVPWATDTVIL